MVPKTWMDKVRQAHPVNAFLHDKIGMPQQYLIKSVCKYTGGGTKLCVFLPTYQLDYAREKNMEPSIFFTLATEGFLSCRHLLNHSYPPLPPLIRALNKHHLTLKLTGGIGHRLDMKKAHKTERLISNREIARAWKTRIGFFYRHRRQIKYMMDLQESQINGAPAPPMPQGITVNETWDRPYLNAPWEMMLTLISKKTRDKYIVKELCQVVGGGRVTNITVPTYLVRHIKAAGIMTSLFLILAASDYMMMMGDGHKYILSIAYNIIMQRAAAERDTPEQITRAVLFKENQQRLNWLVSQYKGEKKPANSKKSTSIITPKTRTRVKQVTSLPEDNTLGDLKDLDIDAYHERLNNEWPDLSPEDKQLHNPERYFEELRQDGNAKENYGNDPEQYQEMDLPDLAEQYPQLLAQEVDRRWNTLNLQQQKRFNRDRYESENPDPW